ncbi:MAG: hypothetical protein V4717_22220 [Bacteroidota bacterium]
MALISSIPDKYEDGFRALASMEEEDFIKLKDALSHSPLCSSMDKLAIKLNSAISNDSDLRDIFASIGSLSPVIESKETIDEIVKDIVSLCEEYDLIDETLKNTLSQRLSFFLNNKQIFYASKAEDLLNSYGNAFIKCRVISDIRPIFELDLQEDIKAAMIVHNLSIHYQSSEEPFHKDINLCLTSTELQDLKEAIIRAEAKHIRLQSLLDKSDMLDLNE